MNALLSSDSLSNPEVRKCPFGFYNELREKAPVYYMADIGFYFVAPYELAREVIRNTKVFSNRTPDGSIDLFVQRSHAAQKVLDDKGFGKQAPTMLRNDPPKHATYRKLVDYAFRASRIRQMEEYLITVVGECIGKLSNARHCDAVSQFAVPVPVMVIADVLGVPRSDLAKFKEWSDAYVTLVATQAGEQEGVAAARLVVEMNEYLLDQARQRRVSPKVDLLTDLVQARYEDERPLDEAEVLSILQQILIAGNETTTNSLASGLLYLARDKALQDSLRRDLSLIPKFVDEILRLESPVQGLVRFVTEDTELAGVKIPKGARVLVGVAAANRDAAKFDNGEAIDVRRSNAGAHFAFGMGTHHCVGSELARLEMRESFKAWLTHFTSFELAHRDKEMDYIPSFGLRGLKSLELSLRR